MHSTSSISISTPCHTSAAWNLAARSGAICQPGTALMKMHNATASIHVIAAMRACENGFTRCTWLSPNDVVTSLRLMRLEQFIFHSNLKQEGR